MPRTHCRARSGAGGGDERGTGLLSGGGEDTTDGKGRAAGGSVARSREALTLNGADGGKVGAEDA